MTVLSGAQAAALVRTVDFPAADHVALVAIAKATSGLRIEARQVVGDTTLYGLFGIDAADRFDPRLLATNAVYNATAARLLYDELGLRAWSAYATGLWHLHELEARQSVALAASAVGSYVLPGHDLAAEVDPFGDPRTPTYGGLGPRPSVQIEPGQPSPASQPTSGGLGAVRILGAELEGDIGAIVIGNPKWTAGVETVPHLALTVVDQDYALHNRGLWRAGARVRWSNLDLRIDTVKISTGGHGTGQAELSCIDDIVYSLMQLRGPRSAHGVSVGTWIAQELSAVGIDPARYLLVEATPTQGEIVRDVPDQEGQSGRDQEASGWTTLVRLAKELGKRVFVSGRRLVFGSAQFAMQWCAEGELRIGWDSTPEGERWFVVPETTRTSVANRDSVLQIVGTVNHNRAPYFRPGVPVRVQRTPGAPDALLMVARIEHPLVESADGAQVTLIEPVDPPPQPPPAPTAAALNSGSAATSGAPAGGGYDSQAGQIVAIALQQTGKRYVFGAEVAPSDANPRAFDCSELVEYACSRAGVSPRMPDGSANQRAHCSRNATLITAANAIAMKGALLFYGRPTSHVAISLGNGKTIEAMNPSAGVRQGNAHGRNWEVGARIPGVKY